MSRKNVVHGYKMLNAVDSSIVQTSGATNVEQMDKLGIHALFSSASSGTFKVQARNGASDGWFDLNFGSSMTISNETDVQIILNECPFTDIRLVWTPSSSTGTLTASLTMKAVGN
jgi:hypothetical protein